MPPCWRPPLRGLPGGFTTSAGDRPRTVHHMLTTLNAVLGAGPRLTGMPPGPVGEAGSLADPRKAEAELDFCPATDFEKALLRCVRFHLVRPARPAPLAKA